VLLISLPDVLCSWEVPDWCIKSIANGGTFSYDDGVLTTVPAYDWRDTMPLYKETMQIA